MLALSPKLGVVSLLDASTRLRLDIAYDGTGFAGWSKQPGLRTVQGEIEASIATVLRRYGEPPTLTVAGRTDAGVHALGQVAHLDVTAEQLTGLDDPHRGKGTFDKSIGARSARLGKRINGIAGLGSDLYVKSVTPAPPGFDARFSATWRRYEYRVADTLATRNPLLRNHTLWYPGALDVSLMNAAADELLGLHDFAAYCKPREGATTIRTLQEFVWTRADDGVLVANLKADAFCHSMVRALVGATLGVGERKLALDRAAGILEERQRTSEYKVVPAKGLALLEVGYPDDAELALRAEQTRARRELPLTGTAKAD
jgi:tRNA pseudouridine38-40 synthase